MSSNESIRFLQDLHQLHNDPLFVEFLQQLFPWVSSLAADSGSSEQGFRHIRWETEEIGKVLFAVHDNSEGILRLMRGSSDRPRCSWSQLLHGQHTTISLHAKLAIFILDLFSFARPKRVITRYGLTGFLHRNGVWNGEWVVEHRDLACATDGNATGAAAVSTDTSPDCPAIFEETRVFLQVESPDGQDHLRTAERDVIIKIRVTPGSSSSQQELGGSNEIPCQCHSRYHGLKSNSEMQASIQSSSSVGIVPLTRQNAMSSRSDNYVKSGYGSESCSSISQDQDSCSDEAEERDEYEELPREGRKVCIMNALFRMPDNSLTCILLFCFLCIMTGTKHITCSTPRIEAIQDRTHLIWSAKLQLCCRFVAYTFSH